MMNGCKLCSTMLAVVLAAGTCASAQAQDRSPKAGISMGSTTDAKGVMLKPHFQSGQSFMLTQQIDRTITMGFQNMNQSTTMNTTFGWECKVLSTEANASVVEMTVKSVSATLDELIKQGDAEVEPKKASWDSSKPEDDKDGANMLMKLYKPLVGARYKVTFGNDGAITSAEALDTVPVTNTKYQAFVSPVTDANEFKLRWQAFFAPKVGTDGVSVGQSWTSEDKIAAPQIGQIKTTTTRTLTKNNDGMCDISLKGAMDILPAKEGDKPAGEFKDTSIVGSCMWDAKASMCSNFEFNQKYMMNVNAQGMQITRGSDSKMKITRK